MSAELIPMPYKLRCDISRCGNKAIYSIGNPDSSKATYFHICEDCLRHFVETLPDEFKPIRIVEIPEDITAHVGKAETTVDKDALDLIGEQLIIDSVQEAKPVEEKKQPVKSTKKKTPAKSKKKK